MLLPTVRLIGMKPKLMAKGLYFLLNSVGTRTCHWKLPQSSLTSTVPVNFSVMWLF